MSIFARTGAALARGLGLRAKVASFLPSASAAAESVSSLSSPFQCSCGAKRFHSGSCGCSSGSVRSMSGSSKDEPEVAPIIHHDIEDLLANNKAWVKAMEEKDADFFKRLGAGQSPKYLYIGCSDSRVPANQIVGLDPGEVFVHRNVGNLVVGSDLNVLSVIDFAVDFLGVQHIIVTGHYDCGAVRAAVQNTDIGLIENWLRNIRDVYRLHFKEVDSIEDDDAQHRRLVELNVMEQCLNVYKNGTVQRKRQKTFKETGSAYPRIHGLVFDPSEGILHKLPVNFGKEIASMRHVYDLYDVQDKSKRGQ